MRSKIQTVRPDFRAAFQAEITGWSWGELEFPRTSSSRWQDKKSTLEDESIFGPRESYRCFCGHIFAQKLEGDYCPYCWSIIEKNDSRKAKFATIPLHQAIAHPFEELVTDLWVIPVLPAAVREQHVELDSLYDRIIANRHSTDEVRASFDEIIAHIWPCFCGSSDTQTKVILGRGMAITPRRADRPKPLPLWIARVCTKCHAREGKQ